MGVLPERQTQAGVQTERNIETDIQTEEMMQKATLNEKNKLQKE